MRNRIERLRLWLAVGAGLLLAVLLGFIGTARYLKRHALAQLGTRLGVDVRSETNGFTYSQSLQGRTIYTLHAAKEIEHANGVIGLHDVSIIIYGRTGDRADMVYGNEFEYDKNAGEVRAIGLVHIDVGGAGSATPGSAAARMLAQGHDDPDQRPKVLHATTSGLVYLNKLGVAATKEPIEFINGELTGHAVGADYSTDTGTLLLHSAIHITGSVDDRPVTLTAAAAQIDNRGQRAVLTRAHYLSTDRSVEANQVILHSRPDSSLERLEADGAVHLIERGAHLHAAHADVALTAKSKVENGVFSGGVQYTRDEPLRQARGEAQQVRVSFDPEGAPLHAAFQGAVHMIERIRRSEDPRQPWSVRDLVANHVETALAATTPGNSELRQADATGSARLTMVDAGAASSHGQSTTELAGDTVTAHLLPAAVAGQSPRLDNLVAQGHTSVRQVSANGIEQTSTGDTLTARFRAARPLAGTKSPPAPLGEALASAVQSGHVRITRKSSPSLHTAQSAPPAAPRPDQMQEASAQQAVYDGDADRVTLTGGIRLEEQGSVLLSDELVFERATGDARAQGAVRVSYTQAPAAAGQGSREPIHVLADHAEMNHTTDQASFYGTPARMWQGPSQLQAPVLELARQQRTVAAHGDAKGSSASVPVQTILLNMQPPAANPLGSAVAGTPQSNGPAAKTPQIIRVQSHDLLYSEADRKVQFGGPVQIQSSGETIRARSATAYLEPASAANPKPLTPAPVSGPFLEGRVDRVLATGDVVVEQPGRRAMGDRLLYLAQDSSVLLTGSPSAAPRLLDLDRGTTVTAFAFRLHTGDESVEALSSLPDAATHERVHTETPARR